MKRNILNIYTALGLLLFALIQFNQHLFKVPVNGTLLLLLYIITITLLILGLLESRNKNQKKPSDDR